MRVIKITGNVFNVDSQLSNGLICGLKKLQKFGFSFVWNLSNENIYVRILDRENLSSITESTEKSILFEISDESLKNLTTTELLLNFTPNTDFNEIVDCIIKQSRSAEIKRETKETRIQIKVSLDGESKSDIDTGIGFFDHMLDQIARHANIDLFVHVEGDLNIDEHHTVEDTGIALGEAIAKALGSKSGIQRYGFMLPMDDSIAECSIDLGGRSRLIFNAEFIREKVGDFPTELVEEFFQGLSSGMKSNIYLKVDGKNDHHKIESIFKSFAKTLNEACRFDERNRGQNTNNKGNVMIALVEYGAGNTASVANALDELKVEYKITNLEKDICDAEKIIFPGVGEASSAIRRLHLTNLFNLLRIIKRPLLGICLGMQLLHEKSEEGETSCLGILPGTSVRFDDDKVKVPHMGWNKVEVQKKSKLFTGIDSGEYFYFAHSFYLPLSENTIASASHGTEFTAAVEKDNFYGVQFHPEKSGIIGMNLLKNFVELC